MDEINYRQTYERINNAPCAFEKGILSLKCKCSYQHLFNLADRHGVGCIDSAKQQTCTTFLNYLRQQTRFLFKIAIDGPLPHNKEIKVQNGGIQGLQKLLMNDECVSDIANILQQSTTLYGSIEKIPYSLIMPSVNHYKTRPKRQRRQ
ncbi:hypothetical protein MNBD_GAMMA07-276 [hydrothermal vent metagenome]|uniref:Uncharacterized protein n=1 Tax=hydrothermal vent metagenome TaxID=652676 RepID=A0A3B0X2K2_9ZZZZ